MSDPDQMDRGEDTTLSDGNSKRAANSPAEHTNRSGGLAGVRPEKKVAVATGETLTSTQTSNGGASEDSVQEKPIQTQRARVRSTSADGRTSNGGAGASASVLQSNGGAGASEYTKQPTKPKRSKQQIGSASDRSIRRSEHGPSLEQLRKFNVSLTNLKADVKTARTERKALLETVNRLATQIDKTNIDPNEFETVQKRNAEHATQLKQIQRSIDEHTANLTRLSDNVQVLNQSDDSSPDAVDTSEDVPVNVESGGVDGGTDDLDINSVNTQYGDLEHRIDTLEQKPADHTRLDDIQNQLDQYMALNTDLRQQVRDLTERITSDRPDDSQRSNKMDTDTPDGGGPAIQVPSTVAAAEIFARSEPVVEVSDDDQAMDTDTVSPSMNTTLYSSLWSCYTFPSVHVTRPSIKASVGTSDTNTLALWACYTFPKKTHSRPTDPDQPEASHFRTQWTLPTKHIVVKSLQDHLGNFEYPLTKPTPPIPPTPPEEYLFTLWPHATDEWMQMFNEKKRYYNNEHALWVPPGSHIKEVKQSILVTYGMSTIIFKDQKEAQFNLTRFQ